MNVDMHQGSRGGVAARARVQYCALTSRFLVRTASREDIKCTRAALSRVQMLPGCSGAQVLSRRGCLDASVIVGAGGFYVCSDGMRFRTSERQNVRLVPTPALKMPAFGAGRMCAVFGGRSLGSIGTCIAGDTGIWGAPRCLRARILYFLRWCCGFMNGSPTCAGTAMWLAHFLPSNPASERTRRSWQTSYVDAWRILFA